MALPLRIPKWVTPDWMDALGYEILEAKGSDPAQGYFKYGNKAGHKENDDYGIMARRKRIVYFNCSYYSDINHTDPGVYCSIREDGDTRTVFAGIITSAEEFKQISAMVR